ncbi:MAG: YihY/virulence factor BrkB family protein [Desulfobulbales bacterium]|nr:YihY/virulence factor BrkB family protein [Desulfobulbales bacterium]
MNDTRTDSGREIHLGEKISRKWQIFCDWVWQTPHRGEDLWIRFLRAFLRIIFIVVRESREDRITLRASALTFTVVLSLVPMLALGTAVLKGLGAGHQMRQAAYTFIEQFAPEIPAETSTSGVPSQVIERQTPTAPPVEAANGSMVLEEVKPAGLNSHLQRAVDQIFDYVDRTDFTTLGTFGIIGLVLAVLGLLGSIEQSMNAVWQTTAGRAMGRKIIDYMALMILLPISVNLALATAATLQSPALQQHIQNILPMLWLERFFLKALPLVILVITFSLLYQFLPNTRVGFIPALAGGLFGGITWFWVQIIYVKLQIGVAKYNAIYGSFATLPLFLLWIYIAWIVFLLGAEVAFAMQSWRQFQWQKLTLTPAARLAMAFDIMESALADYGARNLTDRKSLAQHLNQPEKKIGIILNDLVEGGLLRRVEGKLESYVPAGPLNKLKPSEIMDIVLGRDIPDVKGCDLARQALQAARKSLDNYTINCEEITENSNPNPEDTHCGKS